MSNFIFYPEKIGFVKNKAKQLQKAFPGLPHSTSQEITAVALGFQGWFDCASRLKKDTNIASLYDEQIAPPLFIDRRHQQFCALVDSGYVAPADAEYFVRCWGLTSEQPATGLSEFATTYTEFLDDMRDFESGTLSSDSHYADKPEWIADGIVLGHDIKYTYYALDAQRFHALPPYIRGNSSAFLRYETGYWLSLSFKDVFSDEDRKHALDDLSRNPLHTEWATGRVTDEEPFFSLKQMRKVAEKHPDSWFPLSVRLNMSSDDAYKNDPFCYVPALQGEHFIHYLDNQGDLKLDWVQWFQMRRRDALNNIGWIPYSGMTINPDIRLPENLITPCKPYYHSPFKHGPMAEFEYNTAIEGGGFRTIDELDDEGVV